MVNTKRSLSLLIAKHLKRLIIRAGLTIEFLLGPALNKRAFSAERVLIYPQSGIGDQILSASAYFQIASKVNLHLILPSSIATTTSQLLNHPRITIHKRSNPKLRYLYSEFLQYLALAIRLKARFVSLSDLQLRFIKYGSPHKHPNEICYEILGLDFNSYNCPKTVQRLFPATDQTTNSKYKPYAIVDHFVGTFREIPSSVLLDIQNRGLEIIHPSKSVEFKDLRDLLLGASELHVVNSSFLCFALMLNPNIESKNVYIIQKGFIDGHQFYDQTWKEFWMRHRNGIVEIIPLNRREEYAKALKLSTKIPRRVVTWYFKLFYKNLT
jgi:hypothetical protein